MLSNNALQRNVVHRGHPVLAMDCALAGVEWASCPSAELGRQIALKQEHRERDSAVIAERDRRVRELYALDRSALEALREESTEMLEILGKPVEFTTFVSRDYPGKLIVLVSTDEPWLGFARKGSTAGFWVTSNGERVSASDNDILDFFGQSNAI